MSFLKSLIVAPIRTVGMAIILVAMQAPASAQEVLGIFLEERGTWGVSKVRYVPHLLFANGDIFANINMPVEDLDAASSKKAEPERWGRWHKERRKVFFVMPGGGKK